MTRPWKSIKMTTRRIRKAENDSQIGWMRRRQAQDVASSNMESTDKALKILQPLAQRQADSSAWRNLQFADYYSPSSESENR